MLEIIFAAFLLLFIFLLGVLAGIVLCTLYMAQVAPALVKEMRRQRPNRREG